MSSLQSQIETNILEELNLEKWVTMGGPGSGHRGHKGRKGKRGGSAPSKAGGKVPANAALQAVMPQSNIDKLSPGPGGGLYDAKIESRRWPGGRRKFMGVFAAMYNPKTRTLLAGSFGHTMLHKEYAPDQNYDDFVKMHPAGSSISVYLDRHQASGTAEAWDMAFKAARVMKGMGYPKDMYVDLEYWESKKIVSQLKLEEMSSYAKS